MTREPGKSSAASIRARLLSLAQATGEDYQRVLGRFAIERFLYRLGASSHQDRFVLKGAILFTIWTGKTHRPTKDLDLLGRGSSAIDDVEQSIREICERGADHYQAHGWLAVCSLNLQIILAASCTIAVLPKAGIMEQEHGSWQR